MDAYNAFDNLACKATQRFHVNTSTFYGRKRKCTDDGEPLWWVQCEGMGLPVGGVKVWGTTAAAAVAAMASRLKRLKADREADQLARDLARRAPITSPETAE